MKKTGILLLFVGLTSALSAQSACAPYKQYWFDIQLAQHIGLNTWSHAGYVNDGLPAASLTELKGVLNFYIAPQYLGGFVDMGVGIMPASRMNSFDLERMPMPYSGTQYYLREMRSESGSGDASAHFKMTVGLFGKIPSGEKLTVMPYFGIGLLSMQQRRYEMLLKEHGSNMQYETTYIWNRLDVSDNPATLGYLTGRVNFKFKRSKSTLMLGLEYTRFFNTLNFYGQYINTFNANMERSFSIKGNKMNMIGLSVGTSF